jgi:hypothetical protein
MEDIKLKFDSCQSQLESLDEGLAIKSDIVEIQNDIILSSIGIHSQVWSVKENEEDFDCMEKRIIKPLWVQDASKSDGKISKLELISIERC